MSVVDVTPEDPTNSDKLMKSQVSCMFKRMWHDCKYQLELQYYLCFFELREVPHIPEAIKGELRSAIGKSKLVFMKQFVTFDTLIDQYLAENVITVKELNAVWSVIKLDVAQLHTQYQKISECRSSGWVLETKEGKFPSFKCSKVETSKTRKKVELNDAQKRQQKVRRLMLKDAKDKMRQYKEADREKDDVVIIWENQKFKENAGDEEDIKIIWASVKS